jgi:hypothetical protein
MWRNHQVLADQTAMVMRDVAVARRAVARTYDTLAERASGPRATHLRARARRFEELADRALRLALKELDAADG